MICTTCWSLLPILEGICQAAVPSWCGVLVYGLVTSMPAIFGDVADVLDSVEEVKRALWVTSSFRTVSMNPDISSVWVPPLDFMGLP